MSRHFRTPALFALVPALFALLASPLGGCGDPAAPTPDVVVPIDGEAPDGRPDVDEGNACCPLGTCPNGQRCYGDTCLPTHSGGEACYFDGECAAGARCEGATTCSCGQTGCTPETGVCRYPEGCCNSVDDCGSGADCVNGRCVNLATLDGGCWSDAQCEAGKVCEGANVCPCGAEGCEDSPGYCATPGVCCASDRECGADGACVEGRCVPAPKDGGCWADTDCTGGESCLGEVTCPCTPGAGDEWTCAALPVAGRCGVETEACCATDADCGEGMACLEGRACVPALAMGSESCFVDGQCGAGRICDGAVVCGCNEDGCVESQAGTCRTPVIACTGDSDCPVATKCTIPDRAWCPDADAPTEGVCVPLNDEGCWNSSECNPNVRCGSEVVCDRPEGCAAPNRPGICEQKVRKWDCCNSHLECGEGLECRNQNSTQTCPPTASAICVPIPVPGETCWNFEDCPQGLSCQKTIICGCNGRCRYNRIGQCERPTNCQANIDCGTEAVCARDAECILSPCSTVSTCPFGGTCQDKEEGFCWNHESCPSGQYCEGLKVCPPDTTCPYPNSPGVCQPRVGLGECCTSFRGCEAGLRCTSAGTGAGCSLDSTSVCVPATAVSGTCYDDQDCDRTEFCQGEEICPCGLEDCAGEPPRPGVCAPR